LIGREIVADPPNACASLQGIAVAGLRRYGHDAMANAIAERWIAIVAATKHCTERRLKVTISRHVRSEGVGICAADRLWLDQWHHQ
jgi:alpha,alpha-trehalase